MHVQPLEMEECGPDAIVQTVCHSCCIPPATELVWNIIQFDIVLPRCHLCYKVQPQQNIKQKQHEKT